MLSRQKTHEAAGLDTGSAVGNLRPFGPCGKRRSGSKVADYWKLGRAKIVAASENHANRPSGRWRTLSNRWLYLVPARCQRATGKLHDRPDSMGRIRRDLRGGRNHCVGCCREKANAEGLGSVGWSRGAGARKSGVIECGDPKYPWQSPLSTSSVAFWRSSLTSEDQILRGS